MYLSFVTLVVFGILAASFALLVEILITSLIPAIPSTLQHIFSFGTFLTLLGIACIEESAKYLFLSQYAKRFSANIIPSLRISIPIGALFGAGFAIVEIFLATGTMQSHPSLAIPSMAMLHIITGIMFSVFLFSPLYRRLTVSKRRLLASYLIASAILLHTLYNMYVFLFA